MARVLIGTSGWHYDFLAGIFTRSEDLRSRAKVKVNTTFLVGERYGRLSTPCLRT